MGPGYRSTRNRPTQQYMSPPLLERIQQVCPLPAATQRVVAITGSDDANMNDVAEAIALDAGMAAEVLRLANSAGRGQRSRIDTLEQAVVSLGLSELHNMAVAMGMLAAFASDHELSSGLHEKALTAGSIGRFLAPELGLKRQRSVAFLAGLLSDVGAMGLLAVDGDRYANLLIECKADLAERADREVELYGQTSFALGADLLEANGLPESITEAVRGEITSAMANLTSYVRLASATVAVVADQEYDAIEEGGVGDRLETLASETELEIDRLQLVLLTLDAAGVADKVWSERVA